ncbi:MAG: nickel pincer cofactor biosynthesis protein LarC [Oscillospiraceae bacterium]|nr:nickel pincer cofactor biosynthesis protein LarC [Oscillospiraceae bacterium]
MKTLYFDCSMGAAGDMLSAAMLELISDKKSFLSEVNSLIPGVHISAEESTKCGIKGTHLTVRVHGEEEHEHMHDHHHEHEHEHHHEHHHHHHSGMSDIEHIVSHLNVSGKVKEDVMSVYRIIAEAESAVHGVDIEQIHFHEVGTMDAVADVTMACLLMEKLGRPKVMASPVHVGSGQVKCAHGILPVPAPATALILKGVPIYSGSIKGELCTPTGAAILKHFCSKFAPMPTMSVENIGYGMGTKDFEAANCVRAFIGFEGEDDDTVTELSCNIDDMTPEWVGFAMETLLSEGALDVYTLSAGMKKCRPGIILTVLCKNEDKEKFARLIFKHTSTIGIRESTVKRYTLKRETVDNYTVLGPVRSKRSSGYGAKKEKYEFEDLARIAREKGKSLAEVVDLIG